MKTSHIVIGAGVAVAALLYLKGKKAVASSSTASSPSQAPLASLVPDDYSKGVTAGQNAAMTETTSMAMFDGPVNMPSGSAEFQRGWQAGYSSYFTLNSAV